jgi:hypothetical protein
MPGGGQRRGRRRLRGGRAPAGPQSLDAHHLRGCPLLQIASLVAHAAPPLIWPAEMRSRDLAQVRSPLLAKGRRRPSSGGAPHSALPIAPLSFVRCAWCSGAAGADVWRLGIQTLCRHPAVPKIQTTRFGAQDRETRLASVPLSPAGPKGDCATDRFNRNVIARGSKSYRANP